MCRITSVDHLPISVSDFERSKRFYGALCKFLGIHEIGIS